jgi:hypothetical protein
MYVSTRESLSFCGTLCTPHQGPGSHGAKGLCQEKSYATGLLAGNAAAQQLGLKPVVQVGRRTHTIGA